MDGRNISTEVDLPKWGGLYIAAKIGTTVAWHVVGTSSAYLAFVSCGRVNNT